jgi:hypothetical protein
LNLRTLISSVPEKEENKVSTMSKIGKKGVKD